MYEIGDKVIYQGADKKAYKRRGVVKSIEDKDGKPQLTVELENGETFTAPIDDWSREFSNACVSTNSVVRNAMAVAARNAGRIFDKDLDEVTNKLEKVVRGLKQVRTKLGPIFSERNRLLQEGSDCVYAATPQGDPKTVAKYKALVEEFITLQDVTR